MDRTPDNDTTKTSAGISKRLLTPCRRVGLTRNRKLNNLLTPQSLVIFNNETPATETPKTKRTKLCKNISNKIISIDDDKYKINLDDEVISTTDTNESINFSPLSINVSTQLSQKSDEDSDSDIPLKMLLAKDKKMENANLDNSTVIDNTEVKEIIKETFLPNYKEKNGNSVTLSKRCVSAISKKMMKRPIDRLDKTPCENVDDDFQQTLVTSKKVNSIKKLEKSNKSTSKDKSKTTLKEKNDLFFIKQNSTQSSSCTEDDDDFDIKKTILIRKSYNKEASNNKVNLIKAKSTGTITAQDIEEINLRIQKKQQALARKEILQSNEELEKLIAKWRNGCQIALERLLTLMKERVPEKSNMEMEELIKMLNIPVSLVKYNIDACSFG